MRILALDIGEKRTGVAVSDPSGRVASPVAVIDTRRAVGDGQELRKLLSDYEDVGMLVIGLPVSMDGTEGKQAQRVRQLAEKIRAHVVLPVEYIDERLTSTEAERRMAETGADSRARRGSVDMVAASIMLQTFLDSRRAKA